jgi:hypothetical protein
MFHKDLPWLVRSYFARFKRKASDPRAHYLIVSGDIRLRTRRALLGQLLFVLLLYGLAAIDDLSGGDRFGPARSIILAMWLAALAAYLAAPFVVPRIRSALVAQAVFASCALPGLISSLSIGAQMMLFQLGPQAVAAMFISFAVSCVLIWMTIGSRRAAFYELLRKRRYRRLLHSEGHTWSPTFDLEQSSLGRVGCIGIGLSVSGPAIGANLDEMIGRPNANLVLGIIPFFMGLILLCGAGYRIGLYVIEMRRIESRIGRPLTLPPYRGEDEPLAD